MQLILVRHAHSDPGHPDELRPLSPRGREQARELGARLAAERPAVVLSSPLLRARETAAAIAKAADVPVRIDDRLAPGADAADVVEAAADAGGGTVVTVGHQPDCSEIAFALGAGEVEFPPAGTCTVTVP